MCEKDVYNFLDFAGQNIQYYYSDIILFFNFWIMKYILFLGSQFFVFWCDFWP